LGGFVGKTKLPIRTVLRQATELGKGKYNSPNKPSFQVYPGDLKKDAGYQALDLLHKGAWWELMIAMNESEQRGRLMLNGKAIPLEGIANILGVPLNQAQTIIQKLLDYGLASEDPKTNILYCRRMVRETKLASIRRVCGHLGGNPVLLQNKRAKKIEDLLNQGGYPPSSSSFSSSTEDNKLSSVSPLTPQAEKQTFLTPISLLDIWDAECAPLAPMEVRPDLHEVRLLVDHFNLHAKNGRGPEEYWKDFVGKCRQVHPDFRAYLSPLWFAKDLDKINKLLRGVYSKPLRDGGKDGGTKRSRLSDKGSHEPFKNEKRRGVILND
jgi:hypothetical protein